jgi:hypothetical protein
MPKMRAVHSIFVAAGKPEFDDKTKTYTKATPLREVKPGEEFDCDADSAAAYKATGAAEAVAAKAAKAD